MAKICKYNRWKYYFSCIHRTVNFAVLLCTQCTIIVMHPFYWMIWMSVLHTETFIWSVKSVFCSYASKHSLTKPNGCQEQIPKQPTKSLWLTILIWFDLESLSCKLQACDLPEILSYPRERNTWSFARSFEAWSCLRGIALPRRTLNCLKWKVIYLTVTPRSKSMRECL